jgi:hypothetical protein
MALCHGWKRITAVWVKLSKPLEQRTAVLAGCTR